MHQKHPPANIAVFCLVAWAGRTEEKSSDIAEIMRIFIIIKHLLTKSFVSNPDLIERMLK
jgi:hypothetical protein